MDTLFPSSLLDDVWNRHESILSRLESEDCLQNLLCGLRRGGGTRTSEILAWTSDLLPLAKSYVSEERFGRVSRALEASSDPYAYCDVANSCLPIKEYEEIFSNLI